MTFDGAWRAEGVVYAFLPGTVVLLARDTPPNAPSVKELNIDMQQVGGPPAPNCLQDLVIHAEPCSMCQTNLVVRKGIGLCFARL